MSHKLSKERNISTHQGNTSDKITSTDSKCLQHNPHNVKLETAEFDFYQSNVKLENAELDTCQSNVKLENVELGTCQSNVKSENVELGACQSSVKLENDEFNSFPLNIKHEIVKQEPEFNNSVKSEPNPFNSNVNPKLNPYRPPENRVFRDRRDQQRMRAELRSEIRARKRTIQTKDDIYQASVILRSRYKDDIDLEIIDALERQEYVVLGKKLQKIKQKAQGIKISGKRVRPVDMFQLDNSNIGYRMLRGMGWKDGEALGATSFGIKDPIEPARKQGRGGLGL